MGDERGGGRENASANELYAYLYHRLKHTSRPYSRPTQIAFGVHFLGPPCRPSRCSTGVHSNTRATYSARMVVSSAAAVHSARASDSLPILTILQPPVTASGRT